MLACDALRAQVICILHPLAFLIKEDNFKWVHASNVSPCVATACPLRGHWS
jgi:hypothetical protein